ncbi:MAG TPA: FkbM family methyltransferase [Actinomycetota bacterium]
MRDGTLKAIARGTLFREGAVRRIRLGPLRGRAFRIGPITGLSPWYSGAERPVQAVFRALVGSSDVAIDVGANWGLHTLCLSGLVERSGRVIAMEPFPPAADELEWHARRNGCDNVTVLRAAAGGGDGTAFFRPGAAPTTGSFRRDGDPPSGGDFETEVRALDSVVREFGLSAVKLVKIDVEGAESMVLSGASALLRELRPYVVVELHTPEQDVAVAAELGGCGYRISRISGPPIQRIDVGWPHPAGVWGSILATPLP